MDELGGLLPSGKKVNLVHRDQEQAAEHDDVQVEQESQYHPMLDTYFLLHDSRPPLPVLGLSKGLS
jgi:hypothetical protein